MEGKRYYLWGPQDELAHIDNLGCHAPHLLVYRLLDPVERQIRALTAYINANRERDGWGRFVAYAEKKLGQITKK